MLLGDSRDTSLYPGSIIRRILCSAGTTLSLANSEEMVTQVRKTYILIVSPGDLHDLESLQGFIQWGVGVEG